MFERILFFFVDRFCYWLEVDRDTRRILRKAERMSP